MPSFSWNFDKDRKTTPKQTLGAVRQCAGVVRSETQCSVDISIAIWICNTQDSRFKVQDLGFKIYAMNDLLIGQMQNMLSVDKCWLHSYRDCQVYLDVGGFS